MATSYHSTPSVIEKKKPLNQKKPFYKKKAVYIILAIVLASVAWYNSLIMKIVLSVKVCRVDII